MIALVASYTTALLLYGWLWSQRHTLHPDYRFFLFLVLATAATGTLGCLYGLRKNRYLLSAVCLFPGLLWAVAAGTTAFQFNAHRQNWTFPGFAAVTASGGAALFAAWTEFAYEPHSTSPKLVMFFTPPLTGQDRQSYAAMLMQLHEWEHTTKVSLTEPIHWVRGPFLGGVLRARHFALKGIAFGSLQELPDARLDRHELAHAFAAQMGRGQPPSLLVEGWAEYVSRARSAKDYYDLLNTCPNDPTHLLGPEWYQRHKGMVYYVGPVFVEFLIEQVGMDGFLRLYDGAHPTSFAQDLENALGLTSSDMVERFYDFLHQKADEHRASSDRRRACPPT